MPGNAGAIRAGRAFVELFADDSKLVRGLKRAQMKIRAFGAGLQSTGTRLLSMGTAAAAPFAAAIGVFTRFSDRMAEVRAITGANENEFARLEATAKKLGRTTSFTASQVAEGMKFLGMAGFNTEQILAGIPAVLDLARAGAVDLGLAADIASDVGSAFGMTADQIGHLADVMAKTATSANTSVEMMGESFKFVAPVARSAGQSLEETAAAIGILGNNGIKASMAGTDLKNILSLLANKAKSSLAKFGVSTSDAAGNMRPLLDVMNDIGRATRGLSQSERLAFFMETFGKISGKSAILLADAGQQIDDMRGKLAQADGAARKAAKTMDANIGGAFRALMSAAEGVAIEIGNALAPTIQEWAKGLTGAAQFISKLVKNNKEFFVAAGKVVAIVIGLGAALLTLGILLKGAALAFGTLAAIASGVGTALGVIGTALGAILSPMGLVIAGLGALVLAFVRSSGGIRGAWENVTSFLATAWHKTISFLSSMWDGFTSLVRDSWKATVDFLIRFGRVLQTAWQKTIDTLGGLFGRLRPQQVGVDVEEPRPIRPDVVEPSAIQPRVVPPPTAEPQIAEPDAVAAQIETPDVAAIRVPVSFDVPSDEPLRSMTGAFESIREAGKSTLSRLGKFATNLFDGLRDQIGAALATLGTVLKPAFRIITAAGNVLGRAFRAGAGVAASAIEFVSNHVADLGSVVRSVASAVARFLKGTATGIDSLKDLPVLSVFKRVAAVGLRAAATLTDGFGSLVNAAANISSRVLGLFASAFRSIAERGLSAFRWIVDGAVGVWNAARAAFGRLVELGVSVFSRVRAAFAQAWQAIRSGFQRFGSFVVSIFSRAGQAIAQFFSGLVAAVPEVLGWIGEKFRELWNTATTAFQGIRDALAAGDMALAAKVLWLSLKLEWQRGIHALNTLWVEVKETFLAVWTEAVFGAARIATNAWAELQSGWTQTVDFLLDAWAVFTTSLTKAWHTAIGFIRKAWVRLKSLFDDDVDVDAEVTQINKEIAGKTGTADDERNRRIFEREQQRRRRLKEIEGQRSGALEELEQAREREHVRRREQFAGDLNTSEAALSQARREWQQAIDQSARKRQEAEEKAGQEAAGADKPSDVIKGLEEQLGGIGDRLDQTQAKLSVSGTFNALAVRGLGGGSPAERTAKATEETAKHTKKLAQEAQHGGLTFT